MLAVKATAVCKQGIRLYLQAVAAQVDASAILPGESPGLLRLAAAQDATRVPMVADDDEVIFAGVVDWVCERAQRTRRLR